MQVIKRDGRTEEFRVEKVQSAVERCFVNSMGASRGAARSKADRIARRVVNFLVAQKASAPGVEDVQRAVIHQLWADGEAEAAEQYTLYREEHRLARESRPVPPEVAAAVAEDAKRFPTQLQYYQFVSKFARWREADRRRETWTECVGRTFDWFATVPQFSELRGDEVDWLRRRMLGLEASPAMRVVQMAGPALERCHVGAYNCAAHPICDLFAFSELLYILMQGTGASFSVESEFISDLPRVARQGGGTTVAHVVDDSTEGWCEALLVGLEAWFGGWDVDYDYSRVRPAGARLRTKGGRASGPGPLRDLLAFTHRTVLGAQGRRLTDLEVHDVCCMIGKIVQVGGVRRASCLSHSDLSSVAMRECKHGEWWRANVQRTMANNSAVYETRPPVDVFMSEVLALVKSRSGERGIFNREAVELQKPKRRGSAKWLVNPCAEINLRPYGFCNLSLAVLRGGEDEAEVCDRLRAAAYFGVLQSCCTRFRYIRDEWRRHCEEERLIGVDVMGHLNHLLLCPGARHRELVVARMFDAVQTTVDELSERFGIARSAADTCLKPGGDSGAFFDSISLSPYYARYQIRRTRESANSPVCRLLKAAGVPWEVAPEDPSLVAFSWPKKNPDGCITRHDMTAVQQLENWLFWKKNWAEHSCSVTVYVREHEWLEVAAWCYRREHWDHLTGVSFLPWDEGTYTCAPHEEISEEKYREMVAAFPTIDWSKLQRYEDDDQTASTGTYACTGGVCET